jgi:hypothetical protein
MEEIGKKEEKHAKKNPFVVPDHPPRAKEIIGRTTDVVDRVRLSPVKTRINPRREIRTVAYDDRRRDRR